MRLTAELILQAAQFVNAIKEREIDLRGLKIPAIENLGATHDQFDTIDLTDNEIRKLENFPRLLRLHSLLISNNRITRFAENLHESLPNLHTLILNNNTVSHMSEIDALATFQNLRTLSLVDNPVTTKQYFRLYVIHKIPQLTVLDFKKIRLKERQAATELFESAKGQKLKEEVAAAAKTFVPGDSLPIPPDQMLRMQELIKKAKNDEEVAMLESVLKDGTVSKFLAEYEQKQAEQQQQQQQQQAEQPQEQARVEEDTVIAPAPAATASKMEVD
eukprot:gnl/Hemi2/5245_TR1815_c0_g1_i1.p1 gnl/Hemi2/5245_TR1815_c0_g1~~gnl/Hemi2/5245_TR1815_c0_g1_i1.p1  ORF type:complete len:274 (+),score=112.93 gnl/Hemi2/5245_TR1815_c0_g1_i1:234-1055(+)